MDWIKKEFAPIEPKPDDWFSIRDIAKISGDNIYKVTRKVKVMLANGELIAKKFMQNNQVTTCYKKKK